MVSAVLLDVLGLEYSYGDRKAVDGVHLSVRHGELLGLLGANGAGKTSTLSCIAGLLSHWKGDIRFDGQPFRPAESTKDRALLGIVPQELAVYENLSGKENLSLFAELCGLSKSERPQRIQEMLVFAGLEGRANDLVKQYSGGMKRRLNLAAGLIHRPKLLLLDEPTVGVDPQSRNHLFESMLQLKQSGISMIYTTHYMEEAEKLCDRIAIINEGRVIAVGTTRELANQIGDPTADLERVFLQLTGRTLRDE